MLPDGGPRDKRAYAGVRYVRAPVPLHFPTEAEMPESKLHLALRTFLFQLLQFTFGESCSVGSEQLVYWRASDPKTCLAPDAFLKLGPKDSRFDSWKTWERVTPELAVEIVSESDRCGWDEKLAEYRDLGVRELVRFDAAAEVGERLRVWDRVADDLVERVLDGEAAESFVLERFWVIGDVEGMAVRLGGSNALFLVDIRWKPETMLNPGWAERVEAARATGRYASFDAALADLRTELRDGDGEDNRRWSWARKWGDYEKPLDAAAVSSFIASPEYGALPTNDVLTRIGARVLSEGARRLRDSDFSDMRILSLAIPYCDLVITDKYMSNVANGLRLGVKYATHVLPASTEGLFDAAAWVRAPLVSPPPP